MRALFILFFGALFFQACMCSPGCTSTNPIEITFDGYNTGEIDSVLIASFVVGSNFSSSLDQVYVQPLTDPLDGQLKISLAIEENIDYQFTVFPDTNQFSLTNIKEMKSEKKRGCLGYTKEALSCPLSEANASGNKIVQHSNSKYTLTK